VTSVPTVCTLKVSVKPPAEALSTDYYCGPFCECCRSPSCGHSSVLTDESCSCRHALLHEAGSQEHSMAALANKCPNIPASGVRGAEGTKALGFLAVRWGLAWARCGYCTIVPYQPSFSSAPIVWRDRMDVPSQCTIVRTGR
jgi:hypothetical protein